MSTDPQLINETLAVYDNPIIPSLPFAIKEYLTYHYDKQRHLLFTTTPFNIEDLLAYVATYHY